VAEISRNTVLVTTMEPLWINGNVHAEPVQLANNQDNSNNNSRSHFEPFSNIQN